MRRVLRQGTGGGRKVSDAKGAVAVEHAPSLSRGNIDRDAQAWLREENFECRNGFFHRVLAERNFCSGLWGQTRANDPIQFRVIGGLGSGDDANDVIFIPDAEAGA